MKHGDKTILITGCSSGIGYDSAKVLKQRGYRVLATARKKEDVKRLQDEGFESFVLNVDLSKSIEEAFGYIKKECDEKLYAVFNNAGYGQMAAVEDIKRDILKAQFETNFFGMWELTTKAIALMRKQGYGRIIQHSSVLGLVSLRFRGAYNASKYAIEGMNDTLRLELKDTGIYVVTINTGPVKSDFRKNAILKFKENIDIKNSYFKDEYNKELLSASSNKKVLFARDSDVVIKNLIHALESKKPNARYYNTKATYILATLKRVLPTSWLDRLLVKI